MSDRLESEIQKARDELAAAKAQAQAAHHAAALEDHKVSLAEMRLFTLEDVSRWQPAPEVGSAHHAMSRLHSGNKGRQPGSISHPWRRTLLAVRREAPEGANDERIAMIAAKEPELRNVRPRDVRARMGNYTVYGYVEAAPAGWRVTDVVVSKFGSGNGDVDAGQTEQVAADPSLESAA